MPRASRQVPQQAMGAALVHTSWSGNMVYAQYYLPKGTGPEVLGFWFPEGGRGMVASDILAVSSKAKNPILAHHYINFLLDNDNALLNMSYEKANAFAERWVETVRRECLDWTLVLGRGHLERPFGDYVAHYNSHRPHRGLGLAPPEGSTKGLPAASHDEVRRRDLLGGLIHEYYAAAG